MKEIAIANQVARRRDAGMEEDESKGSTHWITHMSKLEVVY